MLLVESELALKKLKFDIHKVEENDADGEQSLDIQRDEIRPVAVDAETQSPLSFNVHNQHINRMSILKNKWSHDLIFIGSGHYVN